MRVLCVLGTRPEAVKLAPVIHELRGAPDVEPVLVVTGQHRTMVDGVLATFGLTPDHDLAIGRPGQTLAGITAAALGGLEDLLPAIGPDAVVVQGDTTTAMAAGLAAFYAGFPVAHVEAGLRTGDPTAPFPEEVNRRVIAQLATLHLAPTPAAAANLRREGIDPATVICTGNTVIDALHLAVSTPPAACLPADGDPRRLVLVTVHRRESWGGPITGIARALRTVALAHPDIIMVLPAHANPVVRRSLVPLLADLDNVIITDPLPYGTMAHLLARAHLVVTDSGGLQEEAPSLGVPVLVLRDRTERPEAIAAGTAMLIGTSEQSVTTNVSALLADASRHGRMAQATNPFGDSRAAARTVQALRWRFAGGAAPDEFVPAAVGLDRSVVAQPA